MAGEGAEGVTGSAGDLRSSHRETDHGVAWQEVSWQASQGEFRHQSRDQDVAAAHFRATDGVQEATRWMVRGPRKYLRSAPHIASTFTFEVPSRVVEIIGAQLGLFEPRDGEVERERREQRG